jgi:hypothetical protein
LARKNYAGTTLAQNSRLWGEFSTGVPMNQIPENVNISFLETEDDLGPSNMRQPVSNPDERQIMGTTASAILGTPSAAWSEALTCVARNSLQVVLSGTEILLADHAGNLQPH